MKKYYYYKLIEMSGPTTHSLRGSSTLAASSDLVIVNDDHLGAKVVESRHFSKWAMTNEG